MSNIKEGMAERREFRALQDGAGAAVLSDYDARENATAEDESLKYYRRKGLGNFEGFEYTQMYQFGYDPIPREDDTSLIPNQFAKKGTRTIFGYDMSTGDKVDNMPHEATAWGSVPRIVVGGALDMAQGVMGFARDARDAMGVSLPKGMDEAYRTAEAYSPSWLQDSAGWLEDIARDVAQFAGGYAGVYKQIGGTGLKSILAKDTISSVVSGQTFNPEEGNIGTLANEYGFMPEFAQFMDSKMTAENEGRMYGRLSMALEEMGIGAGFAGVRSGMHMVKSRYKAYGNELMKQGATKYGEATSAISHPTRGISGDEVVNELEATKALDMVAAGFQITGGDNASFMAMAKESGIDENLAKKAWNNASKEKLAHMATFTAAGGPKTPMNRQKGMINFNDELGFDPIVAESEDALPMVLRENQPYAVDDLNQMFHKRMTRNVFTKQQFDEEVKPTIQQLKDAGMKSVTGDQLMSRIKANRPEFKNIIDQNRRFGIHTDDPTAKIDVKESERLGKNVSNSAMPTNLEANMKNSREVEGAYEEHLFVARNPIAEPGKEGFRVQGHYSRPYVKGFARTTRTEPIPGKTAPKSVVIQEMQSDIAAAASKYGEWSDDQINTIAKTIPDHIQQAKEKLMAEGYVTGPDLNMDAYNDGAVGFTNYLAKQLGVDPNKDMGFDDFTNSIEYLAESGTFTAEGVTPILRTYLATPSAFNQDKAWVRQVVRPVLKEAQESGSSRITLANAESVRKRWQQDPADKNAPFNRYVNQYPKIMKDYFMQLGVPEKNIHMPRKVTDSFYVDLPPELMDASTSRKLPLYSAAGAAPLVLEGQNESK